MLKVCLGNICKRSIQTSVANSHTVTHKPTATPDNPAQLEFNCSGHSDFYIDLNSVHLLLRIKAVKTDAADVTSAESNTVQCTAFDVSFSQRLMKRKACNSHVTSYHYKAYLEEPLNYGVDASGTNLVSTVWFLDSAATDVSRSEDKTNTGYVTRLNYLNVDKLLNGMQDLALTCLIQIRY